MKMMNKKRYLKAVSLLLALILTVSIFPAKRVHAEDNNVIYINRYEDLITLAANCQDDSWSTGKRIILNNDIDMLGKEPVIISVFNGTFEGNNHTISNISYIGSGYVTGLFRYVEKDGMIKELNIKGMISSTGEKECIGGIVGINYGTIKNCTFNGTVKGQKTIGGIAGINEANGTIKNCKTEGKIAGYYYTGGISGKNHGSILNSVNKSGINNDTSWVEEDDEQNSDIISTITDDSKEVNIYSGVDTGGITGYSDGVITRCTNYGDIGYEHTGYNIGGIAGRQSGLMSLCVNNGIINGRKDVGGVVGQLEPYIEVVQSESLKTEVNKLHDLVDKTIRDIQSGTDALSGDAQSMLDYTDKLIDTTDQIAGKIQNFADTNMESLNQITARLDYVSDNIPGVIDNVNLFTDSLTTLNNDLKDLTDAINVIQKLKDNQADYDRYNEQKNKLDEAVKHLNDTISNSDSAKKIKDIMTNPDGSTKNFSDLTKEEREEVMTELLNLLEHASDVEDDIDDILSAVNAIADIIRPYLSDASSNADVIIERMKNDADKSNGYIKDITNGVRDIINYLNAQEDIKFSKIDDSISNDRASLNSELKGITSSLSSLQNNAKSYSDAVNNDLLAVNDQINVIFNIIIDKVDTIENLTGDNIYTDASETDIENTITGKIDSCINKGNVAGDINAGGIAGAMAIDDEDLEGNAAGSTDISIHNTYITKCIVNNSKNNGYVSAKKNGAGGIVGYEKVGIVINTISRGSVECTEGDYAGGIVGQSLTVIKNSNALCQVTGGKYVGGIAGFATSLSDCYAMTQVSATGGRKGSIAGQIDAFENYDENSDAVVSNNYFVTNDVKGIDGISYSGMANEITYNEIMQIPGLAADFAHLTVTYRVDDNFLGTEEVAYGADLKDLNYPDIPDKEGYYGEWPDLTGETMKGNMVVQGEYKDTMTVVESDEKVVNNAKETSLALIEGKFTGNTRLLASKDNTVKAPDGVSKYSIYKIRVEEGNLSEDSVTQLRIKNVYKNQKLYVLTDGEWQECTVKTRGSYMQTELKGSEAVYCIAGDSNYIIWIIIAIICVAAVIIILRIKNKTDKNKKIYKDKTIYTQTTDIEQEKAKLKKNEELKRSEELKKNEEPKKSEELKKNEEPKKNEETENKRKTKQKKKSKKN